MTNFENYVVENFAELDKFTRTIEKVHGAGHPELAEVRQLFLDIQEAAKQPVIDQEFVKQNILRLRVVASDYTPPADGCQAYQKTYRMLKEMDEAFQK